MFHDRALLGRCFRDFVLPVWEYCSAIWCSAANTLLNCWTVQSVAPGFLLVVCLSVTLLIVDPWQSFVCFIRSGVTRCTLLMVVYLDRMCQCGLHAVLWSHIGTPMHRLKAKHLSRAGLLFPSRCPSGTILQTPYTMVWDWRVSRAGPMLFYWPKLLYPYYNLILLSLLSCFCLLVGIVGLGQQSID